jgi:hypothetical protein
MQGLITTRELFRNGPTIVRLWGVGCYLRCVRAAFSGRPCTFLGVLAASGAFGEGVRG